MKIQGCDNMNIGIHDNFSKVFLVHKFYINFSKFCVLDRMMLISIDADFSIGNRFQVQNS